MIAPVVAASLISAGGSLLGGLMGSSAQKKQIALQREQMEREWKIAQMQMEFAEKLNRQGLATTIDAQGNVTYYDEASNTWKVALTPEQAQLRDASDIEQLRQLNIDAPLARGDALRNAAMRSREFDSAQALHGQLDEEIGNPRYKAENLSAQMRINRSKAVNAGFDEAQRAGMRMNLRSGATGSAGEMSRLAKARAAQIAQTMGDPELEGYQQAENLNQSRMGSKINNYSAMASRAAGGPGFQYTPSNIAPNLTQALAYQRGQAGQMAGAGGNMLNAAGQSIRGMTTPDVYNPAATIGAVTNSLADAVKNWGSGTATSGTTGNAQKDGRRKEGF